MSVYELGILGAPTAEERDALVGTIGRMVGEFGLSLDTDVILHSARLSAVATSTPPLLLFTSADQTPST